MRRLAALAGALATLAAPAAASVLDRLERATRVELAGGRVRAELSGLVDLEGWWVDDPPPGLVFGDGGGFVNPRLALFADVHLGRQLYAFAQARVDRGFDPRSDADGDARADEYLLRWTPGGAAQRLHLQVGKFATVVGSWVQRHLSWDNPLVTPPLPYDRVTALSDDAAPADEDAFLARRDVPDRKRRWVPIVWGPSYAAGAAAFGRLGRLDWAVEVKNAALAARPAEWDPTRRRWDEPTAGGRIGLRPTAAWTLGASASSGPYLREAAAASLAAGQSTGDFRHTVVGVDASWAWRTLELWSEAFLSRTAVPLPCARCPRPAADVDADALAYYVEGRWKLRPATWLALRWNQQRFGDVDDARGRGVAWDRDAWRTDVGLGWRPHRALQLKLQYAYTRQHGPLEQGEQLVVGQATLRF